MKLASIDITLFVVYVVALIGIAWWVSREKQGHQKDTNDYFLAGSSLPWWAIGASLIAANISAEQIIGMSGSGYQLAATSPTLPSCALRAMLSRTGSSPLPLPWTTCPVP